MDQDTAQRVKFEEEIVPLILSRLDGWKYEDKTWKKAGSETQFLMGTMPIDHWLKPEAIIASLSSTRGRTFVRDGVGWGYCRYSRWVVETWDGQSKMFRRKGEAQGWLDEIPTA